MNTPTAASADQIPIESLGPPGLKGELHVLAMVPTEERTDAERLHDATRRTLKVTARLSKSPLPTGSIRGDFAANDGSSYLHIPDDFVLSRVRCPEGIFEIEKNDRGEQSIVAFECESTSINDARALFLRAVLPFLDHQAYLANCPLFIASVRIEDPKNLRTVLDYVSPYRETIITPHVKSIDADLVPIYALYRDAKNSHSDFYSFLCYHKMLDGLLGTLRARLRTRAAKKGVQLTQRRDLVPNSPDIASSFQSYVGKPIKVFFDDVMTPQFRNAVAHFITKDGSVLNLSAPAEIDRYANILYISELCVRAVIEAHEAHLAELASAA